MRSVENTVLIIGGGIGGLAAALALQQVGESTAVYECAPVLQEVGAGIGLRANGKIRSPAPCVILPLGSPLSGLPGIAAMRNSEQP